MRFTFFLGNKWRTRFSCTNRFYLSHHVLVLGNRGNVQHILAIGHIKPLNIPTQTRYSKLSVELSDWNKMGAPKLKSSHIMPNSGLYFRNFGNSNPTFISSINCSVNALTKRKTKFFVNEGFFKADEKKQKRNENSFSLS